MIQVEVNNEAIITTLDNLAKACANRQDLMADIAQTMRNAVEQNFIDQGRPAWKKLIRPNKRGLILHGSSGDLRGRITAFSNNELSAVGTNVEYAAVHQFGTDKAGRNKNTVIPARPFLVLTEQDEADILEDIQSYFRSVLDR